MAAANKEFTMPKIDYKDPKTLSDAEQAFYYEMTHTFKTMCSIWAWDPMYINAFVVGMCRSSMEDLVGKEEAIKIDLECRQDIGWADKL